MSGFFYDDIHTLNLEESYLIITTGILPVYEVLVVGGLVFTSPGPLIKKLVQELIRCIQNNTTVQFQSVQVREEGERVIKPCLNICLYTN